MNPNAQHLWKAPEWTLAVLLALLGMLGPFAIDTYLPAFAGIAKSLDATPIQMQQTLSVYLFSFAFMNLFHGALADSFGRRPVVLVGLAVFTLASVGCALSQTISQLLFFRALQGLSTGAGIVVSRTVIRDLFAPAKAQRMMSQVTIFFAVAPAIAPMMGGWLFVYIDWHGIFWFLAAIGVFLLIANYKLLPETLHITARQPFEIRSLTAAYVNLGLNPRFILLALASGVPFNGMFLYVLSAPAFLGEHLQLQPTQFFYFFLATVSGIMSGAWLSGYMAGNTAPKRQIQYGFVIMLLMSVSNVAINFLFPLNAISAIVPLGIFSLGWALMTPVVTLLTLDLSPERRGLVSSLQAFTSSVVNGLIAGVIAPLVMHSTIWLALTSFSMMLIGLLAWVYLHHRWPEIGRYAENA